MVAFAFWCGALNGFQVSSRIMRITDFQQSSQGRRRRRWSPRTHHREQPIKLDCQKRRRGKGSWDRTDRIANGAVRWPGTPIESIPIICKAKRKNPFGCHSTRDDKMRKSTQIYGWNKFFIGLERKNKSEALWMKTEICLSKFIALGGPRFTRFNMLSLKCIILGVFVEEKKEF